MNAHDETTERALNDKVDHIEKTALRKIRAAFEMLQDVQKFIEANTPLLNKRRSFLIDALVLDASDREKWQRHDTAEKFTLLTQAMDRLYSIGGDLYGNRETPWPFGDQEPTDDQYARYLKVVDEFKPKWVDEGSVCTCAFQAQISNELETSYKANEATASASA